MNRKQRRAATRELKKQHGVEDAVAEKMMLFERLPEGCSACTQSFDKTDREMVMAWSVVVREKEKIVRLYCPKCWEAAHKAVTKLYGELDDVI